MALARQRNVRGLSVVGPTGKSIGKVIDTYPHDGGGEIEMILVNVGDKLPQRRWLPAPKVRYRNGRLRAPWPEWQIRDAPEAEDNRWGDPPAVAKSYWDAIDD
jgi:hypothetical protein